MSLLLFLIPEAYFSKEDLDFNYCVLLCLVHDMGEAVIGDLTPSAAIPKHEKHVMESEAMTLLSHLAKHVESNELTREDTISEEQGKKSPDLLALWMDYEKQTSKEAILVKDLDRFEMILQAYQYESGKILFYILYLKQFIDNFVLTCRIFCEFTTLL